jgi:hypothetical protein
VLVERDDVEEALIQVQAWLAHDPRRGFTTATEQIAISVVFPPTDDTLPGVHRPDMAALRGHTDIIPDLAAKPVHRGGTNQSAPPRVSETRGALVVAFEVAPTW